MVQACPCKMHNATNPMKQGRLIVLRLHFEEEKFCNIGDTNRMRIYEAPINMDLNNSLFKFLGAQLQHFF